MIQRFGIFTESASASILEQVLAGVEYCHRSKIIHRYFRPYLTALRDLKPENIVFEGTSPDSKLKIIDFGRSKIVKNQEVITEKAGSVKLANSISSLYI